VKRAQSQAPQLKEKQDNGRTPKKIESSDNDDAANVTGIITVRNNITDLLFSEPSKRYNSDIESPCACQTGGTKARFSNSVRKNRQIW
jgi:hypothetical protein